MKLALAVKKAAELHLRTCLHKQGLLNTYSIVFLVAELELQIFTFLCVSMYDNPRSLLQVPSVACSPAKSDFFANGTASKRIEDLKI